MYCARCLAGRIRAGTLSTDPPAYAVTVTGGEALCGSHAIDALAEVARLHAVYDEA